MGYLFKRTEAHPLSTDEVQEFIDEDWDDLLVVLDGKTYNSEDLYSCDGCGSRHACPHDLDEDDLCEDCAEEAVEERRHLEELRADYRASVL